MLDVSKLTRGALDLDLDDIKTRLELAAQRIEIESRRAQDMELLALVDGVLTGKIRIGRAGLDLDKDCNAVL